MQIKVFNCPDKNFKPIVERASSFFAKELIPNTRIRNRCFTRIRFDGKLEEYGYASIEDYNTRNQPRDFLIEVHPGIGSRAILSTIAHEMVHVKQYIEGELNEEMSYWKGKRVNSDKMEYWTSPWEIEAHGIEIGLITKFASSECLWDVLEGFSDPSVPIVSTPIKWKRKK